MNNDRFLTRVFDTQEKKMIYFGDVVELDYTCHYCYCGVIGNKIIFSRDITEISIRDIYEGGRFIPMTCSGMKTRAKKKKLIYQGDILSGDPHGTVFVEFNQEYGLYECVWFNGVIDDGEFTQPIIKKRTQLLGNSLNDCGDAWEVTDNIYQNEDLYKKLLEGKA